MHTGSSTLLLLYRVYIVVCCRAWWFHLLIFHSCKASEFIISLRTSMAWATHGPSDMQTRLSQLHVYLYKSVISEFASSVTLCSICISGAWRTICVSFKFKAWRFVTVCERKFSTIGESQAVSYIYNWPRKANITTMHSKSRCKFSP